jgi:hypothetical protein
MIPLGERNEGVPGPWPKGRVNGGGWARYYYRLYTVMGGEVIV